MIPISFPDFRPVLIKVALQGYVDPLQLFVKEPVVLRTYSLDSDCTLECSIYTQVLVQGTCPILS